MSGSTSNGTDRYVQKVLDLLALAEGAATQEEAETALDHAQRLMARHALTQTLLDDARGGTRPEQVVRRYVSFTGIFQFAWYVVGRQVAAANDCRDVVTRYTGKGSRHALAIIGFESDVARTEQLIASLLIQGERALRAWWASDSGDQEWYTRMDRFRERRQFILGYAEGVRARLAEARRAGRQEAVDEAARDAGTSTAAIETRAELVLATRSERIQAWMDEEYGQLGRLRASYRRGSRSASAHGVAAGRRTDIGQPGIGRTRQLPGGDA